MTAYIKTKPIIRDKRDHLIALKQLALRTPAENVTDKAFFTKLYATSKAGYDGEVKIDRILENIPLPALHSIIPDFHTQSKFGSYFQFDSLIITNRYILHLEIKNIRGNIEFQENPAHLIRTYEGVQEKLDCPIHQLARNSKALEIISNNFEVKLPIYSAIVFSHSNAKIASYPQSTKILYKNQIDFFIEKLNSLPELCEKGQLQKIIRTFHALNKNFKELPLSSRYSFDATKLAKGMFCLECEDQLHINSNSRIFNCTVCGNEQHSIVSDTIISMFRIVSPQLKRSEIQEFLNYGCKDTILRALKKLQCTKSGSGKLTNYSLPK
ncbi:nuclease-related domain-containing protein [Chryseomicrobium sp. FSL W7-1435]|uniref:nuclease-related domain-containing protein n=1 Tax=Chryseomicrobium sp. FSL W7-1435 TaxID=2921704 RepID=UPI003159F0C3